MLFLSGGMMVRFIVLCMAFFTFFSISFVVVFICASAKLCLLSISFSIFPIPFDLTYRKAFLWKLENICITIDKPVTKLKWLNQVLIQSEADTRSNSKAKRKKETSMPERCRDRENRRTRED